ncbi:hypothetical protein STEG23_022789 [Scotinomys teguina]
MQDVRGYRRSQYLLHFINNQTLDPSLGMDYIDKCQIHLESIYGRSSKIDKQKKRKRELNCEVPTSDLLKAFPVKHRRHKPGHVKHAYCEPSFQLSKNCTTLRMHEDKNLWIASRLIWFDQPKPPDSSQTAPVKIGPSS